MFTVLDRWSGVVTRRPRSVLATAVALLALAGFYGAGAMDSLSHGGYGDAASESRRELAAERALFGNRSVDVVAVYSSDSLAATDPLFTNEVRRVVDGLPDDLVAAAVPYYAPGADGLVSEDGRSGQVLISLAGDEEGDLLHSYETLEPMLHADGLETGITGNQAVWSEVDETTAEDLARAELISLPLVVLLTLLIFGSAASALMPAIVGAAATVGALAIVRGIAEVTEVSVFANNVITLLGIGLAVDYALFLVSRFREELAVPGVSPATAVRTAVSTAGRTVLVSGLTVAAAMSSLLVFPQPFLRSMAYGGAAAVAVAMVATLTILPPVLLLLGRRIDRGRLPFPRRTPADRRRWAGIARRVMARPLVVLAGVGAALLLAAAPILGARWGNVDHRVLPPDAPAHVAAEQLAAFGPEVATAQVVLQGADSAEAARYVEELGTVPGVLGVEPVAERADAHLLRVAWEGGSQSPHSQNLVRDLRAVEPGDGEALVGGLTADTVDLIDSVGERLPAMALLVTAVMLALLFLAFGSVVLPVKAIVMNVLSLGASFGVVAWIFDGGRLTGLLDYEPQGFLDVTNPVLMLAVLIGLSMDYELFLLSRVREEWDRTGDNERAVVEGVQRTGRIITSAALLLAVVIGAFATSGLVYMKELGIGMLVALLVDATVVRLLLVPATMKLLGRWNWWAPRRLDAWWRRHGLRHAPSTTATDQESHPVPV